MLPFITIFKSSKKPTEVELVEQETKLDPSIPRSLQVTYKPNYATFRNWMRNNRIHQSTSFDKAVTQALGQISLPTGTGKTRVQIALHVNKMIELTEKGQIGVFVVGAHRLALCSQLLSQMIAIVVNAGLPFDILFVGSAEYPEDSVHAKFKNKGLTHYITRATSTTNSEEIADAHAKAKKNNRHLICVSTYHSFQKLLTMGNITMCTYDEAHTLIGDRFLQNINLVRPIISFNYFFTATRRIQGASEGMNNLDVFGPILHEEAPRKMIQLGEIVPPKLHIIQADSDGDYDNHTMMVKTVIIGYEQHKVLLDNNSANSELLGGKVLITTDGNKQMFELHNDDAFREYCTTKEIKVFAFSSQEGVFYNFEPISRQSALDLMANLTDEEDAILLHIEILTEGIDLPSITGVMPFRELNTIKLLQTIGRGARLLGCDRKNIYAGVVAPMDWDSYVKPCCWVILPELFRTLGNSQAMKNTINTIVNTYEIPIEEYNVIDRYRADADADTKRITPKDAPNRKDKETGLTHIVENVMVEHFRGLTGGINPFATLNKLFTAFKA